MKIFNKIAAVFRDPAKKQKPEEQLSQALIRANSLFEQFQNRNLFGSQNLEMTSLYDALGLPRIGTITYSNYVNRYRRQEVANRVINAPVYGTWSHEPRILETKTGETSFEKEMDQLAKEINLFYHLRKLDILAMLGEYAILFLGLKDNKQISLKTGRARGLSYVTAIPQDRALINTYQENPKSPQYGFPETYTVTISEDAGASITNAPMMTPAPLVVHESRVIHVAENCFESDIYGVPFLEPIYNRLIGLDKLAGGSPEMFWRGARPGYVAQGHEGGYIDEEDKEDFRNRLSQFSNNLQRWLTTTNMNITALAPQVVSPKEHIDAQLKLISSATRIPLRILTGSERGSLASSQDERSWLTFLEERREVVAEKLMIRPFVDRMIELGVVSEPKSGEYFVDWEPMITLSEKEKAETTLLKYKALDIYKGAGLDTLIPPEVALQHIDMEEEQIELALKETEEQRDKEETQEDEATVQRSRDKENGKTDSKEASNEKLDEEK
jgi:hypothetical protein